MRPSAAAAFIELPLILESCRQCRRLMSLQVGSVHVMFPSLVSFSIGARTLKSGLSFKEYRSVVLPERDRRA
jgi:hypothetical protein